MGDLLSIFNVARILTTTTATGTSHKTEMVELLKQKKIVPYIMRHVSIKPCAALQNMCFVKFKNRKNPIRGDYNVYVHWTGRNVKDMGKGVTKCQMIIIGSITYSSVVQTLTVMENDLIANNKQISSNCGRRRVSQQ